MTAHHRDALERQGAVERERGAEAARQLERVTQQNPQYLERLDTEEDDR